MYKIGIIGGGNMGEAILKSVRPMYQVFVAEKDSTRAQYLHSQYQINVVDINAAVASSDVVIIAVKPQDIEETLKLLSACVRLEKLLISIAAGITTSYIEKTLGKDIRVIRAMPNMPAMISEGITAVCPGTHAKEKDIQIAREIFNQVGKTVVVKEDLMDAVTAVSGSGPAYVFFFMESLVNAAQTLGLKEELSQELVLSTLLGSVHLLEKQKLSPSQLRAKVTSKGGTTQAALDVLSKNNFEEILTQALQAAQARAAELSRR